MSAQAESAATAFTFRAEAFGPVLRVWFMGDLTELCVSECSAALKAPLAGSEPIVVLDLGALRIADSSGLDVIRSIKEVLDVQGRRLLLTAVSPATHQQLASLGAGTVFEYLEGSSGDHAQCPVCDGALPTEIHFCPHCRAAV
jgi:anti-anti-sigma regulatory factor